MAFCNSCGASIEPGAKFCNKCGKPAATAAAPVATNAPSMTSPAPGPAAPAPPSQGGGALKVILIVFAVIVVLGVLGVATIGFVGWRIAKSSHVRQEGDKVSVETPFGTVNANDPDTVVKSLNVDIYPGAEVKKEGTASVSLFGVSTVTAIFETSDSVDKVAGFYKRKFPNAAVTSSDANQCTIVSSDKKNMVTINIQGSGDRTRIQISSVSRKSDSGSSSSN